MSAGNEMVRRHGVVEVGGAAGTLLRGRGRHVEEQPESAWMAIPLSDFFFSCELRLCIKPGLRLDS